MSKDEKKKKNRHAHKTNQPNNMTARASPVCVSMPHICVCVLLLLFLWVVCVCVSLLFVCFPSFVFLGGKSIYLVYLDGTIIKKYIYIKLLVDNCCCCCGCGTTYIWAKGGIPHTSHPTVSHNTHIIKNTHTH